MAWAASLDPDNVRWMADITASRSELILVAEIDGRVAGFGSIVPKNRELRAVYVHPEHGRVGIGGRILAELETLARKHGMSELAMDASLNAEDFYAKRGFAVVEKGEHVLRGGARMSCVKMRKALTPA
jgi:N-acetylglutamate synthase-like GNAT family acetyltransferase